MSDQLNVEAKKNEEIKENLSTEIKDLREKLSNVPSTSTAEEQLDEAKMSNNIGQQKKPTNRPLPIEEVDESKVN